MDDSNLGTSDEPGAQGSSSYGAVAASAGTVYLLPITSYCKRKKILDYLTSKVELQRSPSFFEDFTFHHLLWLASPFTRTNSNTIIFLVVLFRSTKNIFTVIPKHCKYSSTILVRIACKYVLMPVLFSKTCINSVFDPTATNKDDHPPLPRIPSDSSLDEDDIDMLTDAESEKDVFRCELHFHFCFLNS